MTNSEKTTVFNLIVLDESGSMSGVVESTISGCNETIDVANAARKGNPDKMNQFVSIFAFQSGDPDHPSRYILRNKKADDVKHITKKDYCPNGCTPLYDAIGVTITHLIEQAATHEDAMGIITIITDGYENSSTRYRREDIHRLISRVKEMGWQVNFMGANIDVEHEADNLGIESAVSFSADIAGTKKAFGDLAFQLHRAYDEVCDDLTFAMEDRIERRKSRSKDFFKK